MHSRVSAVDDAGFGLIELLVAMVIMAVLAAVAVPIFLGQTAQARDAAVRSDLAASRTAFVSVVALNREATEQNLRDHGQAISSATSNFEIHLNAAELESKNSDWWCLQETSETGMTFHVVSEPGIHEGSCDPDFYTWGYYVDGDLH